jgi:hypothetical protein
VRAVPLVLVALLCTFRPDSAAAQRPAGEGVQRLDTLSVDASRDTLRIAAITLEARGAFDSTDTNVLTRILSFFHVTTKAQFIRNEIPLRVGQPYDSARVAEAERNLRALGVFKSVRIDRVRTDSGMVLHVVTRDVITAQLQESFKNSGGSISWGLTLIESNLLGTLSSAEVGYRHDPDRNTVLGLLSRRRLIDNRIGGTLEFFDRSDGKLFFGQLAQPFFEASSRSSSAVTFDDRVDRILQYRGGHTDTAYATLQNRYVLGRVDYARALRASSAGYLRVGVAAQVRRDDYLPDSLYQLAGFPTRSVTGAFGGYLELSRVNEPRVYAFQSLSYDEDVDLSTTVRLSLFAAPAVLGYHDGSAGIAPGIALHTGLTIPHGFAYFDGYASGLYTSHGLDSGEVNLAATGAFMPTRRHQLLVHVEANALRNPLPGTEFDLGLGAGPRAFLLHSFTGDREYFFTTEYRFTAIRDFLKLADLGLAAFFDVGGAWWSGDARRSGWDAGIGLRSAFGHGAGLAVNRIDLAWRGAQPGMPGRWVIAIGKGLLFSTGPRGTSR